MISPALFFSYFSNMVKYILTLTKKYKTLSYLMSIFIPTCKQKVWQSVLNV